MVELDDIANLDSLGVGIYDFVAEVVVEGQANAGSVPFAEVPGLAWSVFVVDGYFASDGAERCGIVVYGTVVVFPR